MFHNYSFIAGRKWAIIFTRTIHFSWEKGSKISKKMTTHKNKRVGTWGRDRMGKKSKCQEKLMWDPNCLPISYLVFTMYVYVFQFSSLYVNWICRENYIWRGKSTINCCKHQYLLNLSSINLLNSSSICFFIIF